jgi:A/G-specific adenine glycosylase
LASKGKAKKSVKAAGSELAKETFVLPAGFTRDLLDWYRAHARDLPWRRTRDPYRIWVSEVMLQQTRVAAVIPYYERFLERFPDVESLAKASDADLLAVWAGLGYYSRARNLRRAAQEIVAANSMKGKVLVDLVATESEHGDAPLAIPRAVRFPDTYGAIRALPGIGDYTAAAIASIAFGLPYAVLDGNVVRVMARVTSDFSDASEPCAKSRLRGVSQVALDVSDPGSYNQAVMELGAIVCLPRDPKCLVCPVRGYCAAYARGRQNELPVIRKRAEFVGEEKTFLLLVRLAEALVRGRVPERIEDPTFTLPFKSLKERENPIWLATLFPPGSKILMRQHPATARRLAGLWELPEAQMVPGLKQGARIGQFRHGIVNHRYSCTVAWGETQREDFADVRLHGELAWVPAADVPHLALTAAATKSFQCLSDFMRTRVSRRAAGG